MHRAFSRRNFLVGIGGAVVGLPFLEGLVPKEARAAAGAQPYALFYRRANGVQQAIFSRNSYPNVPGVSINYGDAREPERWWPTVDGTTSGAPGPFGALTAASFGANTALGEMAAYYAKTTLVKGLRHPYGTENGHPEGAAQGLTGAGVLYPADQPSFQNCSSLGESLDNYIARQLTPDNPESMYMGVLTRNEAGLSWIKEGQTVFPRAAEQSLINIYNDIFLPFTSPAATRELLFKQRKSVNDLVRSDIDSLKNDPRLSKADQDRLQKHLSSIRDTETALTCAVPGGLIGAVNTAEGRRSDSAYISATIDAMASLAVLAISCGVRRSVLINTGLAQDVIQYTEVGGGAESYEFHAISHRQVAENNGTPLAIAQALHHQIDRFHVRNFKKVLDKLSAVDIGSGQTLLDAGVSVHFSDLGAGQHTCTELPYLYVGGASGKLVTGQYYNANREYLVKFLNTIGAAVGCKNKAGTALLNDLNADNNNYRSKNYCPTYYFANSPAPADGAPPIVGRLDDLLK